MNASGPGDALSPRDDNDPAVPSESADSAAARRPGFRASDHDRDEVMQVLQDAHVNGRLDPVELDERQNQALVARYLTDLPEIIADLPEGRELMARIEHEVAPRDASTGTGLARRRHQGGAVLPAKRGTGKALTQGGLMSGSNVVIPPGTPAITGFYLMAGDKLDLREVMGPGVELEIQTYMMWAGNTILVPQGVRVVDNTFNIMAGNDIKKRRNGDGSNGTLVLSGFSLMAGHDIKFVDDEGRGRRS